MGTAMSQSTIALFILAASMVLFITDLIPLSVTAVLAAVAMAAFGIIGYDVVFSALSSSVVLMIIGMMIMGRALVDVGVTDLIAAFLRKRLHGSERWMIFTLCLFTALASGMTNALAMLAAMLPVADVICKDSNGAIRRKNLYMPLAVLSVYGANISAISASSMMNVSAQLEESSAGRGLGFFEPAPVGVFSIAAALVFAATIGLLISRRHFTFEEAPIEYEEPAAWADKTPTDKRRLVVTVVVFVTTLGLLIFSPLPFGVVSMTGAMVLILTKCVPADVYKYVPWGTVFMVVGSIGMGAGFAASGAGEVTTRFLLEVCGGVGGSPFGMCCVMMLITTIISNFMSNNAAVSITCPIAFGIAASFGCDPVPFALACAFGSHLSCATPLCNGNLPLAQMVGYRFRDYLLYGIPMNVIAYLATCAGMYVVYFM